MFKKIVLLAVTIIITLTLTFFAFVCGLCCYIDYELEEAWKSRPKSPSNDYLSEWVSDTSPEITIDVDNAGRSYFIISGDVYYVVFLSRGYKKVLYTEKFPADWQKVVDSDGSTYYIGDGKAEVVTLFDFVDYDYQATENGTKFIIYISPRADDIFQGKVSEITFTKK